MTNDPQQSDEIIRQLMSGDSHQIWSASWWITKSWDREALARIAKKPQAIDDATRNVDLGGLLRSNAQILAFALRKLHWIETKQQCFCKLYPELEVFNPEAEAAKGRIEILDQTSEASTWEETTKASCTTCTARYQISGNHGYHYPIWTWVAEA